MVKRKRFLALGALMTVLLAGSIAVFIQYDLRSFVRMGEGAYDRYAQSLDLSGRQDVDFSRLPRFYNLHQLDLRNTGLTVEQFDWLRSRMPDCEISWLVPFQGTLLDPDTEELTVSHLTLEDLPALKHLPHLRRVDAADCRDYEVLEALSQAMPDCEVVYRITLEGRQWESDTRRLELHTLDSEALLEVLPYLKNVEQIVLTESLPEKGAFDRIQQACPDIQLGYVLPDRELPLGKGCSSLDLSNSELDRETLKTIFALCPDLEQADLRGASLTDQELMELCSRFPDVFLLWNVPIGDGTFPSDAEEIDLSGQLFESTDQVECMLPYMKNLRKVVMCDCGIGNEEMDALNKRYEDIRFVWMVHIGRVSVRTDAIYFAPVVTREHVYENQMEPLKYCTDLVAIDLGHMAITTCTWAAYMPNLQYLILADTGVSDITPLANHEKLVFLELFITAVRDYSPLLSCPNLEDLNLCYSYGSAEPIKKMTWLKRLWWDGNPYETKGLEAFLPDTECNFSSGSSTGGTWRLGQRCKEQRDILGMPYLVG